ncbi:hypothetical protein GCM10007094_15270 [Pseudovibrio japonicus]|uniref:Uncharacterized protein n=1 Tax=Pseudovibrio japonicus TaxID=366534 RepID=A0ABQ3E7X3_9HYPH|nr:hypothetical protein GCM10007094_15270 [Pseudovibrio japonicus]
MGLWAWLLNPVLGAGIVTVWVGPSYRHPALDAGSSEKLPAITPELLYVVVVACGTVLNSVG